MMWLGLALGTSESVLLRIWPMCA